MTRSRRMARGSRALARAVLVALVAAGAGLAEATCAVGYTGTPCVTCAAGKYKDVVGTSPCTDCPAGKYSAPEGASNYLIACWSCGASTVSAAGAAECTNCADGSITIWTAGSGFENTCTQCRAGKYWRLYSPSAKTVLPARPRRLWARCPRTPASGAEQENTLLWRRPRVPRASRTRIRPRSLLR